MLRLFTKEIKLTIKSIPFLVCVILIILMFWTQCLPKKWISYEQPMDERHYLYYTMKQDLKNGYTQQYLSLPKITLTDVMKKKLKETILLMNPNASDDEGINQINQIDFQISEKDYEVAVNNLNKVLGGSYYIYQYNNDFYNGYRWEAFGSKMINTKGDMINCMENNIMIDSQTGKYEQFFGIISKRIKLSKKELSYIADIYQKMKSERKKESDIDVLYEKYDEWFLEIDSMLGGNTYYGTKHRKDIYQIDNSLQEERINFASIRDKDKITNAYARYYCDYLSILAGFLPAVIGAFALLEERRWRMQELIHARAIRSREYVLAKFGAVVLPFAMCFYILGAVSTFLFTRFGFQNHYNIDYFAFFKYITFWVMPTLLFTTAISMFLSAITKNGIIPIMFQIFVFFLSANKLIGDYPIWKPIIRYNEVGKYEFYRENLPDILLNRGFITLVSVLLVVGTVFAYSRLRQGNNTGRIMRRLRWGKKDDSLSKI